MLAGVESGEGAEGRDGRSASIHIGLWLENPDG